MKYSVVIPFRDRHEHLKVLVPALRKLNLDMEIIVVEQANNEPLRRGALRNEGALAAIGDVIILHDVDYIPTEDVVYWPESDTDVYRAVKRVEFVNMDGTSRSENDTPAGYRTFKDGIDDNFFGGVVSIKANKFFEIGGYNPFYVGWGLEDEDFRERLRKHNLIITDGNGTFKALPHPDSFKNDENFRHNQRLYASRDKNYYRIDDVVSSVTYDATAEVEYGVDLWIKVVSWVSKIKTQQTNPILDSEYGKFILFKNYQKDHVQSAIAGGKIWEPEIMALCEKYAVPGSTVVDVGANMGTFTVKLSQLVGSAGKVIAFEPQRIVYQQLCGNVFLNNCRNVFAYNEAVGADSVKVNLTYINYDDGAPGEVRIVPDAVNGELCNCRRLDESLEWENDITLIKIDVERYEPFVFDGAQEIIERHRPVILFELTTLPLPQYPKDYVIKLLDSMLYNIYKITEWGDYIAIPCEKDDNV